MSIGFTVPFLRLISQSFAGADQVGLLTVAFGTLCLSYFPLLSPPRVSGRVLPPLPAASYKIGVPVHAHGPG